MKRCNALFATGTICALSIFTLMYIYYGTSSDKKTLISSVQQNLDDSNDTALIVNNVNKESKINRQQSLEDQRDALYEEHKALIMKNHGLIVESRKNGIMKRTPFETMTHLKPFKNIKEKIALLKKEIRMLKANNKQIENDIKKIKKK